MADRRPDRSQPIAAPVYTRHTTPDCRTFVAVGKWTEQQMKDAVAEREARR